MTNIRILRSTNVSRHVQTSNRDWIVYGTRPDIATQLITEKPGLTGVLTEISSLPGEYSIITVESGASRTIQAYRGITSSFDIFYCRRPDGQIVVGDHFRNVLSELPVNDRTVPPSVATDQLLFGTRPQDTYVKEVDRLGHGELLEWKTNGSPQTEQFDTLSINETRSPKVAKKILDREFAKIITNKNFEGDVTTMLSGGVDSTLIHTYLDTDDTVSAAFDSPEFEFEVDYAERASKLLGSNHRLIELDEEEFCDQVEKTTAATGYPLQHLQATLMYATVSETPYDVYLNGQLADGLFGTVNAALAHLAQYTGGLTKFLPEVSPEVSKLKQVAKRLQYPATDPDGLAMNFVIHSNVDQVSEIIGEESVRKAKENRLQYVTQRINFEKNPGYANHMHLGHFIDFFQDNTVTPWRHAAHAVGKEIHTPFAGKAIVETVLSIPPSKRYARFAAPPKHKYKLLTKRKYLLKELLEEKLPEYNTRKPKGSSALPLSRYFEDGPLSDIFERYEIPEFIPDDKQHVIRDGSGHVSWYAFSYAVWKEKILKNENLALLEDTMVIEK